MTEAAFELYGHPRSTTRPRGRGNGAGGVRRGWPSSTCRWVLGLPQGNGVSVAVVGRSRCLASKVTDAIADAPPIRRRTWVVIRGALTIVVDTLGHCVSELRRGKRPISLDMANFRGDLEGTKVDEVPVWPVIGFTLVNLRAKDFRRVVSHRSKPTPAVGRILNALASSLQFIGVRELGKTHPANGVSYLVMLLGRCALRDEKNGGQGGQGQSGHNKLLQMCAVSLGVSVGQIKEAAHGARRRPGSGEASDG